MKRIRPTGAWRVLAAAALLAIPCCGGDSGEPVLVNETRITLNPEAGSPARQTVYGVRRKDAAGGDLFIYKGIPYADSTAGGHRWMDPQPPQWTERNAVAYGPRCPQGPGKDAATSGISEDCLYLNVWTPKITPRGGGDLTVMVFIHGGAFLEGSGGSAIYDEPGHLGLYDGEQFVSTALQDGSGVVFVTLNYRLGVLGFLAGDEIGLEGNYGIKDQTRALEWVRRNIALFGGDPGRVMIFGESAGAQSTALHLTIDDNDHASLFRNAVTESNYAITYMTVAEAQAKAGAFSRAMGCSGEGADVLTCLRGQPVSAVLDHQLSAYTLADLACAGLQAIIPWNPVVDGTFITRSPIDAAISKPFVNGSNLSESVPFLGTLPQNILESGAAYAVLTDFLFGPVKAREIRTHYLLQYPGTSPKARFEQVVTDYLWTCFNRAFSRKLPEKAYRYHDIHHGSFTTWVAGASAASREIASDCAAPGVVCHADELPFVFGNPTRDDAVPQTFTPEEASLSLALRNYWIAFAHESDPNVPGQTVWPLDSQERLLQFQAPGSAITAVEDSSLADAANCDAIWDPIGYNVTSSFTCESFD